MGYRDACGTRMCARNSLQRGYQRTYPFVFHWSFWCLHAFAVGYGGAVVAHAQRELAEKPDYQWDWRVDHFGCVPDISHYQVRTRYLDRADTDSRNHRPFSLD